MLEEVSVLTARDARHSQQPLHRSSIELDVTELVRCGETNSLRLAVKSESLADQLATASQYAAHPLGGILRKVQLLSSLREYELDIIAQ